MLHNLCRWHKKSELDEVAAVVEEVSPSAQHQEAPAPPVSRFPQAQPQPLAQQPLVPSPLGLSRYESQKWRDWNTFLQYLQNHRPPLKLACCTGAHVIEFLRYLDQFGKTRVHLEGCDYFGQPNPPVPCACPLRQAWGSLDALIGRLRAGYEEFGGRPESNPFMAKDVRIYLRDVREAQAKASGISYVKKKPKHGSTAASPVAPPPVVTAETAGTMSGAAGEVDDDDEPSSSVGELRQRQRKVATSAGGIPAPAAAARAAQQPPTHAELERVRCVGSGAGGTVWMVRHRGTGQLYALKVLKGNHNYDVRRQIAREIAILRTADHPAVVRCHGMYEHGGELQILLEYMDGGSLNGHHIATEPLLADVARQVLSGIAYLHRRHIVHCGIKPSNLLIDSARHVKIAEFGVGHILKQTMEPSNSSVGTIAYMSPEQINTNLSDGSYAGDVWSFGLSILELYLGRFPFGENENLSKQGDLANLMCAICFSYPPEPPRTASPEFRGFISCCLKKNPAKRLTAAQLLQHPFVASTQPQPQLLAAPPLP